MIIAHVCDAFMTKRRIPLIPAIGLLGCIIFILWSGTPVRTHVFGTSGTFASGEAVLHTSSGTHTLKVELATTPAQRMHGMMHRESWGETQGMLFLLPDMEIISMWMKDTPLPLDMVFLQDNRVADTMENAKPFSTETISSPYPVTAVLELPAGSVKTYDIKPGDKLEFQAPGDIQ